MSRDKGPHNKAWAACRDEACIEAAFRKLPLHHQRFYGRGHLNPVNDPRTFEFAALPSSPPAQDGDA